MAWEDYIPNIFGAGMPQYLPGLLGDKEAAELQNRAKVQGLLGAGLALAQGLSSAGPRRSAAPNILSALAGGVSAGQGAYQGATQNYLMQQKIAESMLEREKAKLEIEGRKKFAEMYPNLAPIAAINPTEAAKIAGEIESFKPIEEIFSGKKKQAVPQISAPATPIPSQPLEMQGASTSAPVMPPDVGAPAATQAKENVLGAVPVEAKAVAPQVSDLMFERDRLIEINSQLRGIRGGGKYIDENNKSLEAIDKQLGAYTAQSFDFQTFKGMLPEQFRPMVDNLESLAYSGAINPKDLNSEIAKISNAANEFQQKQQDFTIEANRVAMAEFGKPINQLTQQQIGAVQLKLEATNSPEYRNYLLAQKDPKFQAYQEGLRRAGATSINMPSESERTAGFLTNRVVNSMQQLQKAVGADPTAASPNFGAEAIKFLTGSDYLKNIANPEKRQQVEAAQLEILDAALTLGTGAAYTREQLENYRRAYFPQIGDKPETIRDKQQRLQALIDSAMIKSGRAAPTASPNMFGITTDDIEKELQRRKGKK